MDPSRTLIADGLNKFHNFHLFALVIEINFRNTVEAACGVVTRYCMYSK